MHPTILQAVGSYSVLLLTYPGDLFAVSIRRPGTSRPPCTPT